MMSRKWGATWNRLDTRLVARWQVSIIIDDRCGNWTYSQSHNHTGLDWIWRTKGCLVGSMVGGWVVDLVFCGWVWEILNKIALQFILNKPMAVAAGVNNSARQRVYSIISGVLAGSVDCGQQQQQQRYTQSSIRSWLGRCIPFVQPQPAAVKYSSAFIVATRRLL